MNKKSPCFPFYPSDFFGDVKVRVMSPDAKAFYLLLLANIWDYDTQYSIPDDEKLLSKLLEIDEQRIADLLSEIRSCFWVHLGRLISRRLKREKDKQDKYIKLQSEKGKRSAEVRYNRGSTVVQPDTQPEANSSIPIPIPIPSPIPKKETTIAKVVFEDGLFKNISSDILDKWRSAYPALDIHREIQKAEAWASANPLNKKSNWTRFLNNWLSRAQDKAPPKKESFIMPAIQPRHTCNKCDKRVHEVVEHRGQMVCEDCLRVLAPEIPDKMRAVLNSIIREPGRKG